MSTVLKLGLFGLVGGAICWSCLSYCGFNNTTKQEIPGKDWFFASGEPGPKGISGDDPMYFGSNRIRGPIGPNCNAEPGESGY